VYHTFGIHALYIGVFRLINRT